MALQMHTLALGNLQDDGNGNNYAVGVAVYILKYNGTLADIYRDGAGQIAIPQDGLNNISDAYGEFTFYVNSGQYISRVAGRDRLINVVGSDYFDSRVDDAVEQITQQTLASRGFRVVGTFADGFTYELFNDVGIDSDGNSWIYVGAGAPNKVVAAGTVPSVGAGYQQVVFNSDANILTASGKSIRQEGIGGWDADTTYPVNGLTKGADGKVYRALLEQSGNDPFSDLGINWELWLENTISNNSSLVFKSVNDMLSGITVGSEVHLKHGDDLKTQGFYTPGDFGGSKYRIRTLAESTLINGVDGHTEGASFFNVGSLQLEINDESLSVSKFGAKRDFSADATGNFNALAVYSIAKNLVKYHINSGHYRIDGKVVIAGSLEVYGDGMGFRDSLGTILERPEGTGSTDNIITVGETGGSMPFAFPHGFTIIGDTTVTHDGLKLTGFVGSHGSAIKDIHIDYVQGIPLEVFNPSTVARVEFLKIERVFCGMDFGTYGGRDASLSRSKSFDGIIKLSGNIDQVHISDCVLLGKSISSNAAINAKGMLGDVLTLSNVSTNGTTYRVDCSAREFHDTDFYVEGHQWVWVIRNTTNPSQGCKSFKIENGLMASSRKGLLLVDPAQSEARACKGEIGPFFIYSNFGSVVSAGVDIIDEVGEFSHVEVSGAISTQMSNEGAGLTGCRLIKSDINHPENIYGYQSVFRKAKRSVLQNPKITSGVLNGLGEYEFDVNDSTTADLGCRIRDKDGKQLVLLLPSDSVSAGKTSLFIHSGDADTLKHVEVGAPDSGGTGFRVLRMLN